MSLACKLRYNGINVSSQRGCSCKNIWLPDTVQAGPLTLYLCMLTVCMAGLQFTELQQKEQMAKLAMARN